MQVVAWTHTRTCTHTKPHLQSLGPTISAGWMWHACGMGSRQPLTATAALDTWLCRRRAHNHLVGGGAAYARTCAHPRACVGKEPLCFKSTDGTDGTACPHMSWPEPLCLKSKAAWPCQAFLQAKAHERMPCVMAIHPVNLHTRTRVLLQILYKGRTPCLIPLNLTSTHAQMLHHGVPGCSDKAGHTTLCDALQFKKCFFLVPKPCSWRHTHN